MVIQSSSQLISAPINQVRDFIAEPKNLNLLLPSDKVSEFESTDGECSFKAQGGINIHLAFVRKETHSVHYQSGSISPFAFHLTVQLEEQGQETFGHLVFEGEVNGFLKMMIEKPLQGLFNEMGLKLKEYFQQN
jgi:carbon monoxide dehydrogenase subunit G